LVNNPTVVPVPGARLPRPDGLAGRQLPLLDLNTLLRACDGIRRRPGVLVLAYQSAPPSLCSTARFARRGCTDDRSG
jgi:hypothetical protein